MPKPVAVTSPCTSAKIGLVPSIMQVMHPPETSLILPDSIIADGFSTALSPVSVISKTPISFVEPKRFFIALKILPDWLRSPSKYSTVSTICSITLGPAMSPPLFTCPTINMGISRLLPVLRSRFVDSLTCTILPGEEEMSLCCIV